MLGYVTLVQGLRQRFVSYAQKVGPEFTKFSIIGITNTILDLGLWNILIETVMADAEVKAKILSSLIAATSAYLMNRYWAFRHRTRSALHREYALFFFFNGVGMLIQTSFVFGAKYGMDVTSHLTLNVASAIGILVAALFRFWSYRAYIWTHPTEDVSDVATGDRKVPVRAG